MQKSIKTLIILLSLVSSSNLFAQTWVEESSIFNPSGVPLLSFSQPRFYDLDADDDFEMGSAETPAMLAGYRNNGFGILLALLHLGYITTADFHHRMHAMNMVYFEKVPA